MFQKTSKQIVALVSAASTKLVRIRGRRQRGVTGVIYGADLIATSSRSLRRDENLSATFGDDTIDVELLGRDVGTDLAVLRFDKEAVNADPVSAWRDPGDLQVGEAAVVASRPGESVRAAVGVFGVVGGGFRGPGGAEIDRYVELDRELPRGFSGSLVVDAAGEAVGLITRGLVRGSTLVLPGTTLARVVDALEKHGHVPRGYLGVGVYPARLPNDVRDALKIDQRSAVAVVGLEEAGPAEQAGVLVGDLIVSVNGDAVESPIGLRAALVDRAQQVLKLRLLRGGSAQDLEVEVGARP